MANKRYLAGIAQFAKGNIDWENDTIKVALLMNTTTADTEDTTITNVDDFTTLDECDSAGYVRKTLTNCAVNIDTGNVRVELDADDVTWTSLPASTRPIQGALVYKHVTNDADAIPIAFIDFVSDVTLDGTNFTVPWNSEGITYGQAA